MTGYAALTVHALASFRRFIPILLFILAAIISGADLAQAEPGQVSQLSVADSPFPDVSGVQWIKLEGSKGRKFLTAILRPEGSGPFPVVVVLHGASGLLSMYMSVAKDVADAGFLVVFGCWQAGQMGSTGNLVCSEATPESEWVADPAANSGKELIALARSLPGARADRIGLYGLSRGGHAALWAASTGASVQAVVVDSPAHSEIIIYPRPPKPLEVLAGLAAPVLTMHGTDDQIVPVEQSREYEKAAHDLGKPLVAVYFQGIGHLTSVELGSRTEARQRAIAFLREQLLK